MLNLSRLLKWSAVALALVALPACSGGGPKKTKVAFVSNNPADFWTIANAGCNKAAEEEGTPTPEVSPQTVRRSITAKRSIGGIKVQGEADILVKFAKCCSPVPGDSIIGFISRGQGVARVARQDRA